MTAPTVDELVAQVRRMLTPGLVGYPHQHRLAREALDVLAARAAEAEKAVDGWGDDIGNENLRDLIAAVGGSDWWFDGRDIFYKPDGLNLDQILVPLPETWTREQEVPGVVAELIVCAVNRARRVLAASLTSPPEPTEEEA